MPPDADLRTAPAAAPAAAPAGAPAGAMESGSVSGFIDRVYERRITGWAWSKAEPDAALEVEIGLDGSPIATVRADRLRQDLLRRRCGDGRHGFDLRLAALLPADARGRLTATAILPGGGRVALRNRAAAAGASGSGAGAAGGPDAAAAPGAPGPAPAPGGSEAATPADAPEAVVAGVPAALRAWLEDFQAVQRRLEAALTGAVRDLRAPPPRAADPGDEAGAALAEALAQVRAAQDELARRVAAIEVVQARIDAATARLDGRADPGDAPDRWLRRAVLGLAALSGCALLLGVASLFS